jgi:hypothetical protein
MGDYALHIIFALKPFIVRTNHMPLKWLAIVSNAHGCRGRWIGML